MFHTMSIIITFWIAVLGFLMSLASWIYTFITTRQNLSLEISQLKTGDNVTFCFMHFVNHSRLPISITRIQIINDNAITDCTTIPCLVCQATRSIGKTITSQKDFYSLQIPIDISTLGATSGYVLFEGAPAVLRSEATTVTFLICTNRGKKVRISLPLPLDFQYMN